MNKKILCVDDDPNILSAYKRHLRKQFDLKTAEGGDQALHVIQDEGPFAVVVSDMNMPGMDGIQFLSRVREVTPDTVRIMLTGNADMMTAIDAVNEGNIFRFLTKPCTPETLAKSLVAGIEQYRLINSERELLRNTLTGSIKILVEIMSLVSPVAFSQASRIRKYVKHIVNALKLENQWQFEVAAMLSQIGCVTLPHELLNKVYGQIIMNEEEKRMYISHPSVGSNLVANIPRLENIAKIIGDQQRLFSSYGEDKTESEDIIQGSQILKVCIDLDKLVHSGISIPSALLKLQARKTEYNGKYIDALQSYQVELKDEDIKSMTVSQLRFGMVAKENIMAKNGLLLVANGQEVTYPVIARLQNFSERIGVIEPFRVAVPKMT